MQDLTLFNKDTDKAITQDIQVFNCELGSIRVIVENGETYFMASDLCQALEYKNGRDMINRLFPRGVAKYYTLTNGGNQLLSYLTEAQMYKLIMRSNAKNAEAFQDWVCGEVIPSIRKTGSYQVAQKPAIPQTYAEALLEAGRLALENEKLQAQAIENAPKVLACDRLLDSSDSLDFMAFSKIIGIGRSKLFSTLREMSILLANNIPYQRYIDRGYFRVVESTFNKGSKTKIYSKTTITPKGQVWLANKLK